MTLVDRGILLLLGEREGNGVSYSFLFIHAIHDFYTTLHYSTIRVKEEEEEGVFLYYHYYHHSSLVCDSRF